jgi:hypothetical protein
MKFNALLTDESMPFIRGSVLCGLLNTIITESGLFPLKIFMATAYDSNNSKFDQVRNGQYFNGIFAKPLTINHIDKIYSFIRHIENNKVVL